MLTTTLKKCTWDLGLISTLNANQGSMKRKWNQSALFVFGLCQNLELFLNGKKKSTQLFKYESEIAYLCISGRLVEKEEKRLNYMLFTSF